MRCRFGMDRCSATSVASSMMANGSSAMLAGSGSCTSAHTHSTPTVAHCPAIRLAEITSAEVHRSAWFAIALVMGIAGDLCGSVGRCDAGSRPTPSSGTSRPHLSRGESRGGLKSLTPFPLQNLLCGFRSPELPGPSIGSDDHELSNGGHRVPVRHAHDEVGAGSVVEADLS